MPRRSSICSLAALLISLSTAGVAQAKKPVAASANKASEAPKESDASGAPGGNEPVLPAAADASAAESEEPVVQVGERSTPFPAEPARESPISGGAVLQGRVLWSAPLPDEPEPLARNAEPYCARLGTELDRSLRVSAGGLAGALVRLRAPHPIAATKNLSLAHLSLASCAFAPRVLGLSPGQHLVIESADPILHSLRLTRERRVVYRRALERSQPAPELEFLEPGVYRVGCDVHPWEVAWVVIAPPEDAPSLAVTDAQGHFRIEGVPAGSYQIDAWHERATITGPALRIRAGTTQSATLRAQPTTALAHEDVRSHPTP